jgi:hypothetical protein
MKGAGRCSGDTRAELKTPRRKRRDQLSAHMAALALFRAIAEDLEVLRGCGNAVTRSAKEAP